MLASPVLGIVATALSQAVVLMTRNANDFRPIERERQEAEVLEQPAPHGQGV